jgi:hypothetical protein
MPGPDGDVAAVIEEAGGWAFAFGGSATAAPSPEWTVLPADPTVPFGRSLGSADEARSAPPEQVASV